MNTIINYFKSLSISSNDYVIAAISGGPDSMFLLDILTKFSDNKINIVCAHVNHKVRIESEEEALKLRKYCEKNNIIFEYMEINDYDKGNFENQARIKRYEFFDKLVKKYNSKYLFTAHHGDDLIETILMRIVRGSSIKGYSGINKESIRNNYKIIRPLLELTKENILDYLDSNNIWYAIDKTNFEDIHTRNRFRKYILPQLKNENNLVHLKFNKFSKDIIECNEYIEKCAKKEYNEVVLNKVLNVDKFIKLDLIIQKYILYFMLDEVYNDEICLINSEHVQNIIDLIVQKSGNGSIDLPNNFKAIKEYNLFYINKIDKLEEYEYIIEKCVSLPNDKKIEVLTESSETDNNIIYLNSEDIILPIKVRSRKIGDKISVKNMVGTKKVNDIFIDNKISNYNRDLWPIVVDSNNTILWIPGLKKSKFDRKNTGKYDIILKYS